MTTRGPIVWLLLAAVSFVIAGLAGFGVILARDPGGRLIYAGLWGMVGLVWLARFYIARRNTLRS